MLELGLPEYILDTNFDELETSLNVKSIADDCNDWDENNNHFQNENVILSINLKKTLKELQKSKHELDIYFKHSEHKEASLTPKISYEVIHNHDNEELFHFNITDDLETPEFGKGYTYIKRKNRYLIQIKLNGIKSIELS